MDVTPQWIADAHPGAAFSFINQDNTSYWVKGDDDTWSGYREQGAPKLADMPSDQLATVVGEYDGQDVTLKVENEGTAPEEPEEDDTPDLDEKEPEPEEPAPDLDEEPKKDPAAPAVTAARLRNLRALIISRNENGDGPGAAELTERFRRDYAAFSEGKTQAEVDAELIAG